jgi:GNAT superfamily N-acetyltransferase
MTTPSDRGRVTIDARPFRDATAQQLVSEYQAELRARIPGLDFGQAAPPEPEAFDPPTGSFLVLFVDGAAAGCGALRRIDDRVGELRRMYLRTDARGQGLGRLLLNALEREAARLGFDELRLDTATELTEALALYRAAGYRDVANYNDNPFADHWLAKRLAEPPD